MNKRPSGEQKDPEELDCRLNNSQECGSGREKSETNPSNHPLPFHRQEHQQNYPDQFKASRRLFFPPALPMNLLFLSALPSFFIPSSFHPLPFSFLLPAFLYLLFCFKIVKITSYLGSDLPLFLLPSFLSFSIPFSTPSLLLLFFPRFSFSYK